MLNHILQTDLGTIIAGDSNFDIIDQDKKCKQFVNMLESCGVEITITESTKISRTTQICLDNLFVFNNNGTASFRMIRAVTSAKSVSDHKVQIDRSRNRYVCFQKYQRVTF